MKYETPQLTALMPAINAIQTSDVNKLNSIRDSSHQPDADSAYADWED